MGNPVHKTIFLLDIEKFGPRLHLEQAEAQRVLYAVLRQVLTAANIEQTEIRTEDRGDAAFVVIDASVPKVPLVRAVLNDLPTALYDYNRLASQAAQVRMRAVVHAGDVEITPESVIGSPVIEAFRLLNADELRDELKETPEASILGVSELIYRDVIRHDHSGIRADHFKPLPATGKEGAIAAWVYASARPAASGSEPSPPTAAGNVTAPAAQATSGNFFYGPATFGGDAVAGDKTVNGGGR